MSACSYKHHRLSGQQLLNRDINNSVEPIASKVDLVDRLSEAYSPARRSRRVQLDREGTRDRLRKFRFCVVGGAVQCPQQEFTKFVLRHVTAPHWVGSRAPPSHHTPSAVAAAQRKRTGRRHIAPGSLNRKPSFTTGRGSVVPVIVLPALRGWRANACAPAGTQGEILARLRGIRPVVSGRLKVGQLSWINHPGPRPRACATATLMSPPARP